MGLRSRNKGKRGEREFAAFLRECGFAAARRGAQFHGGPESPDVVGVPGWHVEVKRTERFDLGAAVAQARDEAGGLPWLVAHKKNRGKWVVVVDAEEFLRLLRPRGGEEA